MSNASKYTNGSKTIDDLDVLTFTNKNGLTGTSCYDAFYTVDNRLILGTANGLSITENYAAFNSITRTKNNLE